MGVSSLEASTSILSGLSMCGLKVLKHGTEEVHNSTKLCVYLDANTLKETYH